MAYNGTGTFNRIYNWATDAANAILVRADRMDTEMDGMATGLSNCITKDGQQTLTANIPFGGFKITGLGTGALPTDGVNYAQVFTSPSFASPTFTGVVNGAGATSFSVPTLPVGTNTTGAASTAYVIAQAFATALPSQATHAGQALITDGATASWGTQAALGGGTGQSSYTVGDILYASGATTLSKLAAGTATYVLTANGAGVASTYQALPFIPPATPDFLLLSAGVF